MIVASSALTGIAVAIGGIVVVLAISAVFYAVGRGEDRDRADAKAAALESKAAEERAALDAAARQRPRRQRAPSSLRGRRRP